MKTFILEWDTEKSGYRMEDFEQDMHYIEYGEFCWSVKDWEKARSGDNFYMVKCDGDATGIVMKGFFTSNPYEAEDWSGQERGVHYMDMRPCIMIHPNKGCILSTGELSAIMPGFQWKGGDSGRELPENYCSMLDRIWSSYIDSLNMKDSRTVSINMIPMASIDDAIRIAAETHYDKIGKDGRPAILEVLTKGLAGATEEQMMCGFLSGILNEKEITAGELREKGFSEKIVDSLVHSCGREDMSGN